MNIYTGIVCCLEKDKKLNYSYKDASAKSEAGEDGPKMERKQSAKKKKGDIRIVNIAQPHYARTCACVQIFMGWLKMPDMKLQDMKLTDMNLQYMTNIVWKYITLQYNVHFF